MLKTDPKASHIVDMTRRVHREDLATPEDDAPEAGASASSRYIVVGQNPGWPAAALVCVCLLLFTTLAFGAYVFYRMGVQNERTGVMMDRFEQQIQELNAGISFDSRRRQLLLGMRDEIMRANPRVSLKDAYQFAEYIVIASEKYPSVSPLMLLAVGIVESGFDVHAVSPADARGLFQIWPSTGRLLARVLEWEFSTEMLFDPQRNTEMAALYLDILYSAYNDPKLVLAEYNGGPLNAGYLRARVDRIAAETKSYVPKVLDVYQRLQRQFERGIQPDLKFMHKDPAREGKELWTRSAKSSERVASSTP